MDTQYKYGGACALVIPRERQMHTFLDTWKEAAAKGNSKFLFHLMKNKNASPPNTKKSSKH